MNVELLKAIATATAASQVVYVGPQDGKPLMDAGYITVDFNNKNDTGVAAIVTDAGVQFLSQQGNAQTTQAASGNSSKSTFGVITTGIVLPKIKRGGGGKGAPSKYPFDTIGVGEFFFVANNEVDKGDAVKTMSSAVGAANQRYSEPVFVDGVKQTKQVERAKRGPGNKAIKGTDGKNLTETVTVDVKKSTRHFTCRPVKKDVQYGPWKAPDDGAVIVREELKD